MAYSRPSVQAGRGLTRSPNLPTESTAGVFDFALNADIATTSDLGVIQVGSGLSITPEGILSTIGGGNSFINITLVALNYTATVEDYYIGATKKSITITLPLGILGKVYVVKNQADGSVKVQGSGSEKLDNSASKTLGAEDSFIAIFDGFRWNLI
jgi:hypothetical protein